MGEGRIDLARFQGDTTLLVRTQGIEGPHIVQTVSEFDQDDARILRHREEEFTVVLDLVLSGGAELDLPDLRDTIDDDGDLLPELLADQFEGCPSILDGIVDESSGDRDRVEVQVGEDSCDLDTVLDIRLPRSSLLTRMLGGRELVGARDQIDIEATQVRLDRLTESVRQPRQGCPDD